MPKMKTHQATAKRFRVTRNKKYLAKKGGQDHFNARDPGKVTRNKRRPIAFSHAHRFALEIALPNG